MAGTGNWYDLKIEGLTGQDLRQAATALRPALAKGMKDIMRIARKFMVQDAGGRVLRKRSGKTLQALRRGRIKAEPTRTGVLGKITHRAFLLNIHERGAQLPALTLRPKSDASPVMRLFAGGQPVFSAGEVSIPARRIPARPIKGPALDKVRPIAQFRLGQIAAATMQRAASVGGGSAAG